MLIKDSYEKLKKESTHPYSDKNGNIVNVPNEWCETEEGRKNLKAWVSKKRMLFSFD